MKDPNIIQIAEELNRKYNPENLSPFPFENLRQDYENLTIYWAKNLPAEVSGAIKFTKKDKQYEIYVNSNNSPSRKHFTLAHEVGHFFLHREIIKNQQIIVDPEDPIIPDVAILLRTDNPAKSDKFERQANEFAANLIMPKLLVTKAWEQLKSIVDCAAIFHVSTLAMTLRLEELDLIK